MKKIKTKRVFIAAAVIILILVFCWIQNNWITVSGYTYVSEEVPETMDGFTIVHISDLHNKMFGPGQQRLIYKTAGCKPDIILVTGDIVDRSRTDIDAAVAFIEEAAKMRPVFYVTGNHEKDLSEEDFLDLTERIEKAGAVWLDDETVDFAAVSGEGSISITGIDNDSLTGPVPQELFRETDHGKLTVLLAHQPQLIKYYAQQGVDMVFSGHAHGGQWRLPVIGGLIAPGQGLFPEYTEGAHVSGSTTMYISRGLGNSIFPLRLFNCPEIVCVELKSK